MPIPFPMRQHDEATTNTLVFSNYSAEQSRIADLNGWLDKPIGNDLISAHDYSIKKQAQQFDGSSGCSGLEWGKLTEQKTPSDKCPTVAFTEFKLPKEKK